MKPLHAFFVCSLAMLFQLCHYSKGDLFFSAIMIWPQSQSCPLHQGMFYSVDEANHAGSVWTYFRTYVFVYMPKQVKKYSDPKPFNFKTKGLRKHLQLRCHFPASWFVREQLNHLSPKKHWKSWPKLQVEKIYHLWNINIHVFCAMLWRAFMNNKGIGFNLVVFLTNKRLKQAVKLIVGKVSWADLK